MSFGYVLACFGQSYTVPIPKATLCQYPKLHCVNTQSYTLSIPKGGKAIGRSLTVDDYGSISISSVLSKILEYCILDLFKRFVFCHKRQPVWIQEGSKLLTDHLLVRCVVNKYTEGGSTVSICALDLFKAFDKVNHFPLFF